MPAAAATLTPGLLNAMSRHSVHRVCRCGFPVPRYPGRYPKHCPHCGTPVQPPAAPADPAAGRDAPPAEPPDPDTE